MTESIPQVGDKVIVKTDWEGGNFTGVVQEIVTSQGEPIIAHIYPDDPALIAYMGFHPYKLGSSHWKSRITILPKTSSLPRKLFRRERVAPPADVEAAHQRIHKLLGTSCAQETSVGRLRTVGCVELDAAYAALDTLPDELIAKPWEV